MTDLPFVFNSINGTCYRKITRFHNEEYGEIIRIGPNKLSFTKPASWDEIYGHVSGGKGKLMLKDPAQYPSFHADGPDVTTCVDNNIHRRLRQVMSYGFSERAITGQEDIIQDWAERFFTVLEKNSQNGAVDLARWMSLFTADLTGDLSFGQSFGNLERGAPHTWIEAIYDASKGLMWLGLMRQLKITDSLLQSCMPKRLKRAISEQQEFARQRVKDRMAKGAERQDFIGYMLRQRKEGQEDGKLWPSTSWLRSRTYVLLC